jgi:hypothetical protein
VATIDPGADGYVELSDFLSAPEPGSAGMIGVAAASMLMRRRRSCRCPMNSNGSTVY